MAVKVGVIGLRRGRGPLGVLANHPLAEVVAVADLDATVRDEIGGKYGVSTRCETFDELLEAGVSAVVVATPPAFHASQSIQALDAGVHVLSEVPAVWTVEEAKALVAAVKRSSASYMFGENVNFFPRTVAWQQFIEAGKIGRITYGEAEYIHDCGSLMVNPDGSTTWRTTMAPIHYCTHSLGPLLAWSKDRIVSAIGLHVGCNIRPELGVIDQEVGLFRTASGAILKVLCGFSLRSEPGRHWYVVYGTEGMLESGRTADSPDRGYLHAQPAETRGPAPGVVPPLEREAPEAAKLGGHGDSEWFMIDGWLTSLVEGTPPPIDVYAGLDMTLPGIYAHLSAEREGERLEVPDPRDWS